MYSWSLINLQSIDRQFICVRFVFKKVIAILKNKPENLKSQNAAVLSAYYCRERKATQSIQTVTWPHCGEMHVSDLQGTAH